MVGTTGICLGLIVGFMFTSLDRDGRIGVTLGRVTLALFNPEMSIAVVLQINHPYTQKRLGTVTMGFYIAEMFVES